METIIITSETEIKRWIREVIREELAALTAKPPATTPGYDEPLLTLKKIAAYLHISLVTLHHWMNKRLPHIPQGQPRPIPQIRSPRSHEETAAKTRITYQVFLIRRSAPFRETFKIVCKNGVPRIKILFRWFNCTIQNHETN